MVVSPLYSIDPLHNSLVINYFLTILFLPSFFCYLAFSVTSFTVQLATLQDLLLQ
jgi:hypothetical protein